MILNDVAPDFFFPNLFFIAKLQTHPVGLEPTTSSSIPLLHFLIIEIPNLHHKMVSLFQSKCSGFWSLIFRVGPWLEVLYELELIV